MIEEDPYDTLADAYTDLLEFVHKLEWCVPDFLKGVSNGLCPHCLHAKEEGHHEDCRMKQLLSGVTPHEDCQ